MGYTNSPIVAHTKLSPNHGGERGHIIDTLTIHCFVAQASIERMGEVFTPYARRASSNYGVGPDGRIGLFVEEKNHSYCSSNFANDDRAITIEVASDNFHPYKITDDAYEGLIRLCVDICQRNNIKGLIWSNNKEDRVKHLNGVNMTCHRDFAAKACPGEWIYTRLGEIADQVNKRLSDNLNTPSSWAADSWNKLIDLGATDGTFPRSPCTREQLSVILDRLGLLDKNI